jgi:FAD/FMN-containing dehydrogenase
MDLIKELTSLLGDDAVVTGADMAPWTQDWTGQYSWTPLCVLRPRTTAQVSGIMTLAYAQNITVVPVAGNTGLSGGTRAEGAIMLSLDRMNAVREIRPEARLAVVEAGVILSDLHDAVHAQDLSFPMTFGAKGSARLGGILSTNAGGSNVLRYGNTRDLVLGIEAVLADGRIVDLLTELHKNNTGYDLRHLLIGAEGTLGIITAAVLKLVPKPRAYATAMVAAKSLSGALRLLNALQETTGGAVEAFEFMPKTYMQAYAKMHPDAVLPLGQDHEVNLLIELSATAPRDVTLGADGSLPLASFLETALGDLFESGDVLDAVVAQSDAQRKQMWAIREVAAEVTLQHRPIVISDVAVALDRMERFINEATKRALSFDPNCTPIMVAHLGDGNAHYTLWLSDEAADKADQILEAVEEVVRDLGGSFSAEHGIGTSKRVSMARRKDPVALDMMRAIKAALDPKGILNPGKVIPD